MPLSSRVNGTQDLQVFHRKEKCCGVLREGEVYKREWRLSARLSRTAVENVAVADWTPPSTTQVSVTRRRPTPPPKPLVCQQEAFRAFLISGGVPAWPRSHNTELLRRDSSLACCPRRSRLTLRPHAARKSLANTTQQATRFNEVSPQLTSLAQYSYCCVCALRCSATLKIFFIF